jgi:hypothetical protein
MVEECPIRDVMHDHCFPAEKEDHAAGKEAPLPPLPPDPRAWEAEAREEGEADKASVMSGVRAARDCLGERRKEELLVAQSSSSSSSCPWVA